MEEAFYSTDRVMTVSFHKFGEYFSWNWWRLRYVLSKTLLKALDVEADQCLCGVSLLGHWSEERQVLLPQLSAHGRNWTMPASKAYSNRYLFTHTYAMAFFMFLYDVGCLLCFSCFRRSFRKVYGRLPTGRHCSAVRCGLIVRGSPRVLQPVVTW